MKTMLLLLVLGGVLGWILAGRLSPRYIQPAISAPVLQGVRELGSLLTLQTTVVDVQASELAGYTGSVRTVLLIKGDVQLACAVDQASFEAVDEEARRAVLVLPPPVASRPRLDHDRTKIWALDRTGLWQLIPGRAREAELVSQALQEAQRIVGEAVIEQELDAQARQRAEALLAGFFTALGWEVSVRWEDRP